MNYYRISKYSPTRRLHPSPGQEEWTSIFDIGTVSPQTPLTMEEYTAKETAYIDCILAVLSSLGCSELTVGYLEHGEETGWKIDDRLNHNRISLFMQDTLREKCWGQLVGKSFIWEAGYDFYMHLGCKLDRDELAQLVDRYGLYWEPWNKIKKIKSRRKST